MTESKPWYLSNAVWASVFQMGVGLLTTTGMINDVAGTTLITDGPGVAIGIITTVLAVWSLIGRVTATKKIASS